MSYPYIQSREEKNALPHYLKQRKTFSQTFGGSEQNSVAPPLETCHDVAAGTEIPDNKQESNGSEVQRAKFLQCCVVDACSTVIKSSASGTVHDAADFDVTTAASSLHCSVKKEPVDEKIMADVLCHLSSAQRLLVCQQYEQTNNTSLLSVLNKRLHGKFKHLMVQLITPLNMYRCEELRRAISDRNDTTKAALIDIICCYREQSEIEEIQKIYKEAYCVSLVDDLENVECQMLQRLLIETLNWKSEENTTYNHLKSQSKSLYNTTENTVDIHNPEFNKIMACRNPQQLAKILQLYQEQSGHSFLEDVGRSTSGIYQRALNTVARCCTNQAQYFAVSIHDTVTGVNNRYPDLSRLIVVRSEIDLDAVKLEFQKLYARQLEEYIYRETYGIYRTALIALVRGNA